MANKNAIIEVFTSTNSRPPTEDELDALVNFMKDFAETDKPKGNVANEEKLGELAITGRFVGPPKELTMKKRNNCYILANLFEGDSKNNPLPSYKVDERTIDETFSWLDFEVQKKRDLSANKIKAWIKEICKDDYSTQDCVALFLMSHGTEEREILGSDSKGLNIEKEIIDMLINVTSLQGKPKLIFIQACRGSKEMKVFKDSDVQAAGSTVEEPVLKAQKADTFVYYSTTQGNKAWVGSNQGSFFINKLCTVLQQYGGNTKYHFGDVVTKVNDILSTHVYPNKGTGNKHIAQVSESCSTLTTKIRFTPKGDFSDFQKNFQYKEC